MESSISTTLESSQLERHDDHWNNPRIREARQDWYEWERDQGAREEEDYNEEKDTRS